MLYILKSSVVWRVTYVDAVVAAWDTQMDTLLHLCFFRIIMI